MPLSRHGFVMAKYILYRPATKNEEGRTQSVLNTYADQGYRIAQVVPNFWSPLKPLYVLVWVEGAESSWE